MKIKTAYFQRLPHFQPIGASFFISFRLHESIPKIELEKLKDDYNPEYCKLLHLEDIYSRSQSLIELRNAYFLKFDELLHKVNSGPTYLQEDLIAKMVAKQIYRFDGFLYNLLAYTIMANHVHLLIDTSIQLSAQQNINQLFEHFVSLDRIMKRIKGPTAVYANRILNRKGQFWQRESYDTYIRNDKMLKNVIAYILDNPVKIKLVDRWEDHPWTYLKHG
jgi:REP element-mobilizing transposase RayT